MACGLQASLGIGEGESAQAAGSRTSASAPEQGVGPGYGNETWVGPNGHLHPSEKPLASKGRTTPEMVSGLRREGGEEAYVEVRGPASAGARSTVPYTQVLAKYRKQAEEAISRKRIPKSRLKRVKDYFESLNKGS